MRRLLALLGLLISAPLTPLQPGFTSNAPAVLASANGAHVLSTNWSGYALQGSFRQVEGTFTVPEATVDNCAVFMSAWVGIDGYANSDLIQAGIGESANNPVTGTCTPGHLWVNTWWEILPADETNIPQLAVSPGDSVTVDITQGAVGTWEITITDNTTGDLFNMFTPYSGPAKSAEWITEAPTVDGWVAPMAPYGVVTYSHLLAKGRAALVHDVWMATARTAPPDSVASSVDSTKALLAGGFSTVYTG